MCLPKVRRENYNFLVLLACTYSTLEIPCLACANAFINPVTSTPVVFTSNQLLATSASMDTSMLSEPQIDPSKFSDSDKREMRQFIEAETQKAKIQECELHCPVIFPVK